MTKNTLTLILSRQGRGNFNEIATPSARNDNKKERNDIPSVIARSDSDEAISGKGKKFVFTSTLSRQGRGKIRQKAM